MELTDLRHYIRVYDDWLDASFCRQMIDSFASLGAHQRRNGRGVRAGLEESAWTELNVSRLADEAFLRIIRAHVDAAVERYNQDVGLFIPLPNSGVTSELVMKRYEPLTKDCFQVHFDSINHLANRYLVLLWYLNDVDEGGQTHFPQLRVSVDARAGRLLMFPPFWMYQHEGVAPRSQEKYILSTYLLFTAVGPVPQTS